MQLTPKDIQRFWSYLAKGDGCWEWQKSIMKVSGYGQFSKNTGGKQKTWLAHRLAYELTYGPIPEGLFVLHSCDNRRCARPEHLSVGTQLDNMRDMCRKKRGAGRDGHVTNTKLNVSEVKEIRSIYSQRKISKTALGDLFGVSRHTIRKALSGQSWAWVV